MFKRLVFCLIVLIQPCIATASDVEVHVKAVIPLNLSLVHEAGHSLKTASDYLIKTQQENGSWKNDPAITALVLYSFLLKPAPATDEQLDDVLRKGLVYLKSFVKPDGGIYHESYKAYTTSVGILAFVAADQRHYSPLISAAKQYLIEMQVDEGEDKGEDHPYYGGIGYGGDDRPDLSNTQFALEAIKAAENYEKHSTTKQLLKPIPYIKLETKPQLTEHWRKALIFLAKTQNVKAINAMTYATNDGGFIYEPGHYKEERSKSYGSMTYAGLKCLLLASIGPEDIRVKRAVDWISQHYTFEENPGFGTTSLYYYYMTASKCLDLLGADVIQDSNGVEHPWRKELVETLLSKQSGDGSWINTSARYWESMEELTTAYSIIAIKVAVKNTMVL